jgi:hypothetical protein
MNARFMRVSYAVEQPLSYLQGMVDSDGSGKMFRHIEVGDSGKIILRGEILDPEEKLAMELVEYFRLARQRPYIIRTHRKKVLYHKWPERCRDSTRPWTGLYGEGGRDCDLTRISSSDCLTSTRW